jgi:hypothetical protein
VVEVKVSYDNTAFYIPAEYVLELYNRIYIADGVIYINDPKLALLTLVTILTLNPHLISVSPIGVIRLLANSFRDKYTDAGSLSLVFV